MVYTPTTYSITTNGHTTTGHQLDINWLQYIAKLPPAQQSGAMQLDSRFARAAAVGSVFRQPKPSQQPSK